MQASPALYYSGSLEQCKIANNDWRAVYKVYVGYLDNPPLSQILDP